MSIDNSLTILSPEEISALDEIPKLDPDDRVHFFDITPEDSDYLNTQTNIYNKINYILQAGYFKAARQFYQFNFNDVRDDVHFIINHHFPKTVFPKKEVARNQHYGAQRAILKICGYQRYNTKFALLFSEQVNRLAKRDFNPRFIFEELLNFCEQQMVIRPKYSTLQSLVSAGILRQEKILFDKFGRLLDRDSKTSLDKLLENENTMADLTLIKNDPKSFFTKDMRLELEKHQIISNLFKDSKDIIPKLGLSRQNIQYYAGLCDFYDSWQLKRITYKRSRMYMLCFIEQRFIKINDHLVTYFTHKMHAYEEDAKDDADDKVKEAKLGINLDRKLASKMLKVVHNEKVDDSQIRPNCYEVVEKDKFEHFTDKLAKPEIDKNKYEWEYYSREFGSIKVNLRTIFNELEFNCDKYSKLKEAISHYRELLASSEKNKDQPAEDMPLAFIPKATLKYLVYKKPVKVSSKAKRLHNVKYVDIKRYEVMLYRRIASAIDSGNIFVSDSVNYRHLEDELIPIKEWEKNKNRILEELSDCIDLTPITELLAKKETELEGLYESVNARIASNENTGIKIDDKTLKWTLPYKRTEDKPNNPFYNDIETTGISKVIDYTQKYTQFFDCFTHALSKGSRTDAKPEHLKAYLVAQGASIGNKRMAEASDVSLDSLDRMAGKFVRANTLKDAGDQIINKIAQLPIFNYYNLSEFGIHASLDGQKIETKYQTILSRYSTKYFGYGKGVVSYSLIANHLPVNTKIIGANEHESHHVLDIVYYNSSNLKVSVVSGDMHSINRVNFALMSLFGYDFMPRFTQINTKADKNLIAFGDLSKYQHHLIKPSKQVDKQLIIDEWDNILRILASLAKKQTSQSTIIRKLSSYSKKNSTLKALIEFDRIVMSTYMLEYIDDIEMRRRVHRALNRGEAFHQLRSAILQISGKKILGKTDKAYEVSNQCNKILCCCMIYYNTSLLSSLLEKAEADGDSKMAKFVKRLSPVAWQHINLIGNFTFRSDENIINIQQVIESMLEKKLNLNVHQSLAS